MGTAENARIGTRIEKRPVPAQRFKKARGISDVETPQFDEEIGQGAGRTLDDFDVRVHSGGDFAMAVAVAIVKRRV